MENPNHCSNHCQNSRPLGLNFFFVLVTAISAPVGQARQKTLSKHLYVRRQKWPLEKPSEVTFSLQPHQVDRVELFVVKWLGRWQMLSKLSVDYKKSYVEALE